MLEFYLNNQGMMILKWLETVQNGETKLEESQSAQQVLLEHGKIDEQIGVDAGKGHRTQNIREE